jgi:hypothetical protein
MQNISYYCQIWIELKFSRQILKNIEISNFMKIRPVSVEFLHQTDMTKLTVDFLQF